MRFKSVKTGLPGATHFRLQPLWIALSVLAFAGCSSVKSPAPTASPRPVSNVFHVVKPGENLFRIGKAYDISVEELAKANQLRDPNQIYIGQRIYIPGASRQLPV